VEPHFLKHLNKKERDPPERSKCRWKNNIKINFKDENEENNGNMTIN
jgi:hypothetical protein